MTRDYPQYVSIFGTAGTLFPDNTTGQISEADMRQFGQDTADSMLFLRDIFTVSLLTTTGTNTYAVTSPFSLANYNSKRFYVKFVNASTGAVTINVSAPAALGAKKVYINPTTQAGNGDLTANQIYILVYDTTLDSAAGGFMIVGGVSTGGSSYSISVSSASTAGGTVTFDFASVYERIFFGSASFSTPKTIALSNDTNAVKLDFTLNITNVAGVLTFPSTFIMDDVRWDTSTQEWTPDATGKYKGSAFFDGTNWLLEISQPYV